MLEMFIDCTILLLICTLRNPRKCNITIQSTDKEKYAIFPEMAKLTCTSVQGVWAPSAAQAPAHTYKPLQAGCYPPQI